KLDGVDEPFRTKTRSDAQVLSGHSAVIWLENVSGCYLLDRVTPAPNVEVTGLAAASLPQGPCGLPGSTPAATEER
ncbi:MAG: hypothetical protein Q8M11_11530, partial [Sulfuritalea sp.]|nr:hypothetical protein [Sulfuritalea sp.]MDP1982367.1 hypothetical protein [Sulfuritalea sp.]